MNKPKSIASRPFSVNIFLITFGCLIAVSAVGIDASNQGSLFGLSYKAQMELDGLLVILLYMGFSGFVVDVIYESLTALKKLLAKQS